jgi:hypothetical protein
MIPVFLRLVVQDDEKGGRGINIWLPLILIWILLAPIIILLLAVWFFSAVAARLFSAPGRTANFIEAAAALIWNMSGLRVSIRGQKTRFVLHF